MRLLSILSLSLLLYGCQKTQPSVNNYPEQEAFKGVVNQDSFSTTTLNAAIVPHPVEHGKYYININCYSSGFNSYQSFYLHLEEATLEPQTYALKHTTITNVKYNYAFYGSWNLGQRFTDFVAGGFVNIHSIANGKMKGNLYFTTEQGRQIKGVFNLKVKI